MVVFTVNLDMHNYTLYPILDTDLNLYPKLLQVTVHPISNITHVTHVTLNNTKLAEINSLLMEGEELDEPMEGVPRVVKNGKKILIRDNFLIALNEVLAESTE